MHFKEQQRTTKNNKEQQRTTKNNKEQRKQLTTTTTDHYQKPTFSS